MRVQILFPFIIYMQKINNFQIILKILNYFKLFKLFEKFK